MLNNEYYSQVFHEIKNSVTLINSYLQLLEKNHSELSSFNYWSASKNETARLCTITAELSQVKPDSRLTLERMDLRDFLSNCCAGFPCFRGEEAITCSLSLPEQPLMVSIDSGQLRHALVNLLKNACEAMEHRGSIFVEALRQADNAVVHITDFGCGIAPHRISHIFDPFFTTKESGSGLGLDIARQIISAHKGTIEANSIVGKGSTFTITLPAAGSITPPQAEYH